MDLSNLPGHLIRKLHQQSTSVFQDHMKTRGFDLTSVQFAALNTLDTSEALDQATVAHRIAYDRATIGGVFKRLEQKGLVERRRDQKDRRAFRLELSEQGKSLLEELRPVVFALQAHILPTLTDSEKATLLDLMNKALKADSP